MRERVDGKIRQLATVLHIHRPFFVMQVTIYVNATVCLCGVLRLKVPIDCLWMNGQTNNGFHRADNSRPRTLHLSPSLLLTPMHHASSALHSGGYFFLVSLSPCCTVATAKVATTFLSVNDNEGMKECLKHFYHSQCPSRKLCVCLWRWQIDGVCCLLQGVFLHDFFPSLNMVHLSLDMVKDMLTDMAK